MLEDPQWIGGSQDKGEAPRIHAEIETITNDPQERLKAHDNRFTGKGFKVGEISHMSLGDLKDEVLK